MTARVPHLPFALDPLIAEAKRRMRRRRYLTVTALVAAALAIAAALTLGPRPGGHSPGAVSGSSTAAVPKDRLIVPGVSIAGIRWGTPRRDVVKRLGPGKPLHRDYVSYMGGRLKIMYSYHGAYTGRVQGLITTWPGFRTRSGVHVGSNPQALRSLHLVCDGGVCGRGNPDLPGMAAFLHGGKVASILVGST